MPHAPRLATVDQHAQADVGALAHALVLVIDAAVHHDAPAEGNVRERDAQRLAAERRLQHAAARRDVEILHHHRRHPRRVAHRLAAETRDRRQHAEAEPAAVRRWIVAPCAGARLPALERGHLSAAHVLHEVVEHRARPERKRSTLTRPNACVNSGAALPASRGRAPRIDSAQSRSYAALSLRPAIARSMRSPSTSRTIGSVHAGAALIKSRACRCARTKRAAATKSP